MNSTIHVTTERLAYLEYIESNLDAIVERGVLKKLEEEASKQKRKRAAKPPNEEAAEKREDKIK